MNTIFYVVTDKNGNLLVDEDPVQTTNKLTWALQFDTHEDALAWWDSHDGGAWGWRVREVYARVE